MKYLVTKVWVNLLISLLVTVLILVFRSSFADWSPVPTGSMKPTIIEGDRIFVNKMAYDIRFPFTHTSLFKISDPGRGDIVLFDSELLGYRLVKRVIGIPGDIVELKNNNLYINCKKISYQNISSTESNIDKMESLFNVKHHIRVKDIGSSRSSFKAVKVPSNYYLVLGDNRDNSADSRAFGFVPRNEIVGRTKVAVFSLNYDNFYLPRSGRFFHTL